MDRDLPLPDLPVPDLDGSPQRADGRTWRVQARAFRDPVGDAERLAAAFGLALSDAQHLVASAPVVLRERVRREEAERIAAILTGIGAKAVVEDTSPPPPSSIPSPPAASAPGPVSTEDEGTWERSFWSELPTAFVAPVLGKGVLAIAGCGALGAATALVFAYAPGIAKLGVAFAAFATASFIGTRANGSSIVNGRSPLQRACASGIARPSSASMDRSIFSVKSMSSAYVAYAQ